MTYLAPEASAIPDYLANIESLAAAGAIRRAEHSWRAISQSEMVPAHYARSLNALGCCCAFHHDFANASEYFHSAVQLYPTSLTFRQNLLMVQSALALERHGHKRVCNTHLGLEGLVLTLAESISTCATVPNVVHFCFGFAADFGGRPFSLVHYLAIRSAYLVNRPDVIKFYYDYEPHGEWWDRAKQFVEMVKVDAPRQIYGNTLYHPAHMTDVVRLERIIEDGGFYLDLDVICLRPLTQLRIHEFAMASESKEALCNAVLIGASRSRFACRWLDEFRSFRSKGRDEYWGEHAVLVPRRLACIYPDEITILGRECFFSPTFERRELEEFFNGNCERRYCEHSYCVHLWEQLSWEDHLRSLSVEQIRHGDSEFCRLTKPLIEGISETVTAFANVSCEIVSPKRFDLGGVGHSPNGRTSVNRVRPADIVHEITDMDAYITSDGEVDEIVLNHTLEHIPCHHYRTFLTDIYRKLRPGGELIVVQTDAASVIEQYAQGALSFRAMRATLFPPADRLRSNLLNQHFTMATPAELIADLQVVGFFAEEFDAGSWPFDLEDEFVPEACSPYRGIRIKNLGVRATKPHYGERRM